METFEKIVEALSNALNRYLEINTNYSNEGSRFRNEMLDTEKQIAKILKKYEDILRRQTKNTRDKEYRKALKFLDQATINYSKYLAEPLAPGVNPVPIPYHELEAASDRLKVAQEWLNVMRRIY